MKKWLIISGIVIVAAVISMIIYGVIGAIILAVFGAAILPTLLTGAVITDPIQIMNLFGALMGAGAIMYVVSAIVGFVIYVFSITLTAESYK